MEICQLRPNAIVRGPLFPEPVRVPAIVRSGDAAIRMICQGVNMNQVHRAIPGADTLALPPAESDKQPFDAACHFRLSVGPHRPERRHFAGTMIDTLAPCLRRDQAWIPTVKEQNR